MKQTQGATSIGGLVTEHPGKGRGKVMRVHRERSHSGRDEAVQGEGQKRLVKDRNQRLGKNVGQRRKARAETRGQNKCGRSIHAPKPFSPSLIR